MNNMRMVKSAESATFDVEIDPNDIDTSQRIVVGFATLDNLDSSNDIVTAEASMRAFEQFHGNVRLMHESRPVGKVISSQPAVYFDPATGEEHSGIQVSVRISKAAEDVWTMCQDGTLSGFSIGGEVLKASKVYSEQYGKAVKYIDEYRLTELSLVDSPANAFANITAIKKSSDSYIEEGDQFYTTGKFSKVFEIKTEGGNAMTIRKSIDETNDSGEIAEETNEVTEAESKPEEDQVQEVVEAEEKTAEDNPQEDAANEEANEEETTGEEEKPAEDALDIDEIVGRVLEDIKAYLTESSAELTQKILEVNENLQKVLTTQSEISDDLQKTKELTTKSLDRDYSENLGEIEKRLEKISSATAIRKSVDSEPDEDDDGSPFKGLFSSRY